MTSRTTQWRRRQRVRHFLCDNALNDAVPVNLIENDSSYFSQHDVYVLREAQVENNANNRNNFDKQSNSFSTYIDDQIQSTEDGQPYVLEEIQPDEIIEDQEVEDMNFFNLSADPSTHEVAAALTILKNRHNLSNRCLDHICQLMRLLKASNVPKGSAHVKRIFLSSSTAHFTSSSYYCSKCNQLSSKATNCSNIKCEENKSFSKRPPVFLRMPLQPQIKDVLLRFPSLNLQRQRCSTFIDSSDISQGDFYKKLLKNEENNFITLTMNVDGILIAKSSKSSLWVITFVINELKKSERFRIQNVLVGGIASGQSKPTRKEMSVYLQSVVNELLTLENEHCFQNYDGNIEFLRVFLIAGSMDKPAQALVQNISEPNGAYGCGKCFLQGITVPTKSGSKSKIRVFPIRRNDEMPKARTNFAYDVKLAIPERFRPTGKEALRDFMYGHLGECHLRSLRYFDIGQSFAFDTLHNLYRGTFMRLLELWFDTQYRNQPWSLISKIGLIDVSLSIHKFPSTICRTPRTLLKYNDFKASELRCTLLFGFASFSMYLPHKYCRHLLLLVVLAHLCESKSTSSDQTLNIKRLANEFIYQFPLLYGDRQNVISIHTIMHLPESVVNFGGVYNYSTFNFESYLGLCSFRH
ncbi:unnamed protein product [Rotaria magnacalcarata]|uniref:Uncharacterized protein n=5 Tax=Rotaria TaxID=231623 RepID=A0A819U3L8_9BILA|nr:unnamed protein product [Rotaria magnacalcarata]CAF4096894.1 unnamed protein product [Rotaria magnacalcarata]